MHPGRVLLLLSRVVLVRVRRVLLPRVVMTQALRKGRVLVPQGGTTPASAGRTWGPVRAGHEVRTRGMRVRVTASSCSSSGCRVMMLRVLCRMLCWVLQVWVWVRVVRGSSPTVVCCRVVMRSKRDHSLVVHPRVVPRRYPRVVPRW